MNNNSSTPAQRSVGFAREADMLVPVTAGARLFLSRHRRQREFNVFYELPDGRLTANLTANRPNYPCLGLNRSGRIPPAELLIRTAMDRPERARPS